MSLPTVSVIMPAFRCAEYLPQAIESVLAQTFSDFELIVVDDGSPDDTGEIVARYRGDRRVIYVRQENAGLPGARNTGVRNARGQFIAAVDADDALAPTALEEMTAALISSGASWCWIDIVKFWDDYREVQRTEPPAGDLLEGILKDDFIRRAMFLRRDALLRVGLWDADMRMREDWDLNIRMIRAKEPYVYLERPLYEYRRRPGSITTGDPKRLFAYTEAVLRKHHKQLADAGSRAAAEMYAANQWALARSQFYRCRDIIGTARSVWESVRYDFRLARLFHPILHHGRLRRV